MRGYGSFLTLAVGVILAALVAGATAVSPADAAFSGANGRIVFTSTRDHASGEIYVMNADGSGVMRLTNNDDIDSFPAFSPGGNKIAFQSDREGTSDFEIWVMNADGSGLLQVTTNAAADTMPDWTTSGGALVYTSDRDGNLEIYTRPISPAGALGAEVRLTNDAGADRAPEATSGLIYFTSDRSGNDDVWIMDLDGDPEAQAAAGDLNAAADVEADPFGAGFAFTSARDGDQEIYTFAPPATQTNRTNDGGSAANDFQPAYAPDGTQIVFVTNRDGNNEIYVMNANGSSQANRTNNAASDTQPDWGPPVGSAPATNWPTCSFGVDQGCIEEFTVSVGGNPANLVAPPATVELNVFAASGFAQIQVVRNDMGNGVQRYDLVGGGAPPLTTSSLIHIELNTGTIDPAVMFAGGDVASFTTMLDAMNGNELTIRLQPRPRSDIDPQCPDVNCGDDNTVASFDLAGVATAAAGAIPDPPGPAPSPEAQAAFNAFRTAARDSWVSTNAQVFGGPDFNTATGAFEFSAAAAHNTAAGPGNINQGRAKIRLSDTLLVFWGLDPATVAGSSFTINQTKGAVTTSMSFTFADDGNGVVLDIPTGSFTYSNPTFAIDAVAPAAPPAPSPAPAATGAPFGADLGVVLSGPASLELGEHGTYTATVTNHGPGAATSATLTDALPAGLTYVSAAPSQGSCYGGVGPVTCNLGTIASGALAKVAIVAEANEAGDLLSKVSVASSTADPNQINQSAALLSSVKAKQVPPAVQPPATPLPVGAPPSAIQPPAAQPPAATPPAKPKPAAKPKAKAKPKKKAAPKKKAKPKKAKPKKKKKAS